jgi:hypothetical protein
MRRSLDLLLLGALATATWHRIAWAVAGRVTLADVLTIAFLALFAVDRLRRRDAGLPRGAALVLLLVLALGAGYLAGFQNVDTNTGAVQWAKGLVAVLPKLAFVVAAAAHLARGGRGLFVRALAAYVGGAALNAAYGVLQLGAQAALGVNLDAHLVNPYFSGAVATGANFFGEVTTIDANGAVVQSGIYRMTALTNDPNHIGILLVTVVVLTAALALGAPARFRPPLFGLAAALLLAAAASQSRSAALGLVAGAVVVAAGARRQLLTRALVAPAAVLGAAVLVVLVAERGYVQRVIEARLQTSTSGSAAHTQVYGLIGPVLSEHPLFGLGLNTFAERYAFDQGKAGFGPHSAYVELLTETGLVGTAIYAVLVAVVVAGLLQLRREARAAGDGLAEAVALGLVAAIAATLAADVFYLTTVFPAWYDLLALAIGAAPALGFAPAPAGSPVFAKGPAPAAEAR